MTKKLSYEKIVNGDQEIKKEVDGKLETMQLKDIEEGENYELRYDGKNFILEKVND